MTGGGGEGRGGGGGCKMPETGWLQARRLTFAPGGKVAFAWSPQLKVVGEAAPDLGSPAREMTPGWPECRGE